MSPPAPPRWARWLIGVLSRVAPREGRAEWLEEWNGELDALARARAEGRGSNYPTWTGFVLGALPHVVWMRREEWTMDGMWQDLRYAARTFRRSPGFTLVAALTLALGIGANASIFSLVNGLLLRPPAGITEPDRLVQIARSYDTEPRWDNWAWPAIQLFEQDTKAFSGVAAWDDDAFVVGRGAETEQVPGQHVNGGYFDALGIRPFLGRLLHDSDNLTPGGHPVVVLSHAYWVRRFGGDPAVVGRTISLGARPYEVVGVAPPAFTGPASVGTSPQLWVPLVQTPGYNGQLPFEDWGWSWLDAVGRLADGVSYQEARAATDVLTTRLREASGFDDIRVLVSPGVGLDPEERTQAKSISLLLAGIVGLVLLLTTTNVANLFLARGATRTTEMGVRLAMGAGRRRLARQLVTESLLLALVATALSVPVVMAAGRFVPMIFPYTLSVSVGADANVWLFLAGVGLLAGILFGVAPAWAAARRDVGDALRETRSSAGRARTRLRDLLVITQLSLSLSLVAGAALLGRSLINARSTDPGFAPQGLVVGYTDVGPTGRYDEESGRRLARDLTEAVRRIPGVQAVTIANQAPIAGGHTRSTVRPADDPDSPGYEAEFNIVGSDYFETMGIPLVVGRAFDGLDEPERVVVVNEALARIFWGSNQAALGKSFENRWRVVGVVGDVQMRSLRAAGRPGVYYPMSQVWQSRLLIHARLSAASAAFDRSLREAVASVDPELPVANIYDLPSAMDRSMGETRTIGYLVAAFAGLALILAAIGLYGLVSFGVAQRIRELGIRIALGARPESLASLVLARGLGIALVGVAVGLVIAYALGQALRGLLFGVSAADPLTLVAAAALLLVTAGMAAWIPARRASRVDAAVSLRQE